MFRPYGTFLCGLPFSAVIYSFFFSRKVFLLLLTYLEFRCRVFTHLEILLHGFSLLLFFVPWCLSGSVALEFLYAVPTALVLLFWGATGGVTHVLSLWDFSLWSPFLCGHIFLFFVSRKGAGLPGQTAKF
jgi:hypothetical protein